MPRTWSWMRRASPFTSCENATAEQRFTASTNNASSDRIRLLKPGGTLKISWSSRTISANLPGVINPFFPCLKFCVRGTHRLGLDRILAYQLLLWQQYECQLIAIFRINLSPGSYVETNVTLLDQRSIVACRISQPGVGHERNTCSNIHKWIHEFWRAHRQAA